MCVCVSLSLHVCFYACTGVNEDKMASLYIDRIQFKTFCSLTCHPFSLSRSHVPAGNEEFSPFGREGFDRRGGGLILSVHSKTR